MNNQDFRCTQPACPAPQLFTLPLAHNSIIHFACRSCGTGFSVHVNSEGIAKFSKAGPITQATPLNMADADPVMCYTVANALIAERWRLDDARSDDAMRIAQAAEGYPGYHPLAQNGVEVRQLYAAFRRYRVLALRQKTEGALVSHDAKFNGNRTRDVKPWNFL